MKQPELGQKISDLRKQKGLTQEELVDQCNINVRTIQRIEAGEVMPRSFTLKTILNALGEDLDSLRDHTPEKNYNLNEANFSAKHIKFAWISGLIYFLLGFVEFAVDYERFYEDNLIISNELYISLKFVILLTFVYFMWGFVRSGNLFSNYLLKIGAFFLIGTMILFTIYDMSSLYFNGFHVEYVLIFQSIFFGIGSFILGFALIRWETPMGSIPKVAGGFEIAAGVMFIMVFLAWLGYVFITPAIVLEIVLLYKIGEFIKDRKSAQE